MPDPISYPGQELELFEKAIHWKQYFSSFLKPYINNEVLETGAGIGSNTLLLWNDRVTQWTLLEPDQRFISLLQKKMAEHKLPELCQVVAGTIANLPEKRRFDTIIYIDVLEHISHDKKELERASRLLKPGGYLTVLAPAFPFLYSPFDKAIGHYRRYTKKSLRAAVPSSLVPVRLRYLDSTGFLLSLANRLLLRQKYPTQNQVHFWDRVAIPVSRIMDRVMLYSFGKTILGTWKNPDDQ
jgi:ubiquinone/menaquinone biosynthesis C-methylase UbiE